MLEFLRKLFLDCVCITLSAIMSLFGGSLLKIFIALVLPSIAKNEIIMAALSLFLAILFSLLLISFKHYLPNKFTSKQVKKYKRGGARNEFIALLKNGENITIFLLLVICFIYTFTDVDLLVIYSPIFWLDNIIEPKILSSGISIITVLIVYFAYLLLYRHSLNKDNK